MEMRCFLDQGGKDTGEDGDGAKDLGHGQLSGAVALATGSASGGGGSSGGGRGQETGLGAVQQRRAGDVDVLVAGSLGNNVKDVGQLRVGVATAQVAEVPVVLDGRQERVVGIVG